MVVEAGHRSPGTPAGGGLSLPGPGQVVSVTKSISRSTDPTNSGSRSA